MSTIENSDSNMSPGTEAGGVILKKPLWRRHHLKMLYKVRILKDLGEGVSPRRIAWKYGVTECTIRKYRKAKDELLKRAKEEEEFAELVKELPDGKKCRKYHRLTEQQKLQVLKELKQGKTLTSLATKYDVGITTIWSIKHCKNKTLNHANELFVRDEESGASALNRAEREVQNESDERVNTTTTTKIRSTRKRGNKMLNSVEESIERNEENNLREPKKKKHFLSFDEEVELLKELKKGEKTIVDLANRFNVCVSTIRRFRLKFALLADKSKRSSPVRKSEETLVSAPTEREDKVEHIHVVNPQTKDQVSDNLEKEETISAPLAKKYGCPVIRNVRDSRQNEQSDGTLQPWTEAADVKFSKLDNEDCESEFVKEELIDLQVDEKEAYVTNEPDEFIETEYHQTEDKYNLATIKEEPIDDFSDEDYDEREFISCKNDQC